MFIKLNKKQARTVYNEGKKIIICPCKFNIYNPFYFNIFCMTIDTDNGDFDKVVSNFEYYNCNHEMGYYAAYYMTEEG
jgi:hypothetical protein